MKAYILILAVFIMSSGSAWADDWDDDYYGGGFYPGYGYGFGGYGLGMGYGFGFYDGFGGYGFGVPYPPNYAYPPVVAVPTPPPAYVQLPSQVIQAQPQAQTQAPAANYWHYCRKPKGYYPYVKNCPGGWLQVAPQPPQ